MHYFVRAVAWKGYRPSEAPSTEVEAIIEVPGDDDAHGRASAMHALDKFAREQDIDYRTSVNQFLTIRPAYATEIPA